MRALKHAVSGITVTELPTHPAERALALQELLVIHATGGVSSDDDYRLLRQEFMTRRDTERLLPLFVRRCRNLSAFWEWIKAEAKQWAPRRVLIREAFTGLLDYLEAGDRAPADEAISGVLESFDEEGVHRAWVKALDRRLTDPEGASRPRGHCSKRSAKRSWTRSGVVSTTMPTICRSSIIRQPSV